MAASIHAWLVLSVPSFSLSLINQRHPRRLARVILGTCTTYPLRQMPALTTTTSSTSAPAPPPVPPSTSTSSTVPLDPHTQYATFLHPTFEADAFAHAVLNGQDYPPPPPPPAVDPPESSTNGRGTTTTTTTTDRGAPGTLGTTSSVPNNATSTAAGGGGGGFMKGLVGENGTGDVSAALARLNFGVEDLNRQLKAEVAKHHSSLLLQAASLGGTEGDLAEVRRGLAEVEGGVGRLKRKISTPHDQLSTSLLLLTRLRRAASLAKRAQRFMLLARRLEGQMVEIDRVPNGGGGGGGASIATVTETTTEKGLRSSISSHGGTPHDERGPERRERAMAEAALTLAEIESLVTAGEGAEERQDDPEATLPIRSLRCVENNLGAIELARERVVEEMQTSVQRGLTDLDQPLLASSLQTSYNLSVLPALVDSLVGDLNDLVLRKVKACFDMATLAREIASKEGPTNAASAFVYKSRTRNEPTQANLSLWNSTMWYRLEQLVDEMGNICIKVYTLEKVLKLKKDAATQTSFLDEAMTVLDNRPSVLFWTSLAQAFESQAKESVRSSNFIQTTLSTGYPRLLRLFQEFFSKIAVHTDTVYTLSQQSPETVLVLRSIQPFETLYLTRSTNRLSDSVSSAFSISSSLAASFTNRPPQAPTANEGLATARAIVNELDAARFDPLLAKAVAKGASRAIETYIQKAEGLIAHDHSATSLLGPLATPSQHNNADLTSSLYHLWHPLDRVLNDHTESVRHVLRPSVDRIRTAYVAIVNPLIMSIRREFSSLLARMHRVDYSKSSEPPGGGGPGSGTTSGYMNDLTDKLTLIKEEVLGSYRVGQLGKDWALDLARFTVQTFLLHASIVAPLGEAGKLKLTADTTSLEFAINQYLTGYDVSLQDMGDQFKALRAFRPLLFLDTRALLDPASTNSIPTLILLHHVLSRSRIPLPHVYHGWTEAEYVRWLNEHGERDRVEMVRGVVLAWVEGKGGEAGLDDEDRESRDMVDKVLDRTR